MQTPLSIAVSMGDPCGIGPEIIARTWAQGRGQGCLVVGDVGVLERAAAALPAELRRPRVVGVAGPHALQDLAPEDLPVWQVEAIAPGSLDALRPGVVDARAGAAAHAAIVEAAQAALRGEVAALVTAPIHKEALHAAGVPYPGHTELLQSLAGMPPVRMMLANDQLRTVLVTIHVSVRQALELITPDAVLDTLRITDAALRRWGIARPRIAVAGLNPHAGEGGLFGDEEITTISPAIARARAEGIEASGPHAPDTVFMRARQAPGHPGEFDVVVAMLHDHGLIPVKYLGLEQGVNVTLGLPFIRTSPDHGTAFDIAGRGLADPGSLQAAIALARHIDRQTGAPDA